MTVRTRIRSLARKWLPGFIKRPLKNLIRRHPGLAPAPFYQPMAQADYFADLDESEALLAKVTPWAGKVPAGYVPNHLGTLNCAAFFAHYWSRENLEQALSGERHVTTERPRIADGEHYFEQCNVIRSVLDARDRFVMVELGGGNGPRAVDCAVALRQRGSIKPFLVVVEALPMYMDWCRHHMRMNGLNPDDHWLINGIVSDQPVPAMMYLDPRGYGNQIGDASVLETIKRNVTRPGQVSRLIECLVNQSSAAIDEGVVRPNVARPHALDLTAISRMSADQLLAEAVVKSGELQIGFVSALTLANVLQPLERVDFMDVDIQFAEIRVIPSAWEQLRKKVKLLSIGTHNHEIHARLLALFQQGGWKIIFHFPPWGQYTTRLGSFKTADGVLTVSNPYLK